jgi:DNA ligase-1
LISRYGKEISCPSWFIDELPKETELDGELWLERGKFELLLSILQSKENFQWKAITFVVFELPRSKKAYEDRIHELTNLKLPQNVRVVSVQECKGNDHLMSCMQEIVEGDGEGLMLNKPMSFYIPRRTNSLLKVKVCVGLILLIFSHSKTVKYSYWKCSLLDFIVFSKRW